MVNREDLARTTAALIARLNRHQHAQRRDSILGVSDLRLLWLFTDGKQRTLRQIAVDLDLEQSTVNRQVNSAVADGLLARRYGESNHKYLFEPTPHGIQQFELHVSQILGSYGKALDSLDDEDAEKFLELLERFINGYGETLDEDA